MQWLDNLVKRVKGASAPDPSDDLERQAAALCQAVAAAGYDQKLEELPEAKAILSSSPEDQCRAVRLCFAVLVHQIDNEGVGWSAQRLASLLSKMLSKKLPFDDRDLVDFVSQCQRSPFWALPTRAVLRLIERRLGDAPASGEMADALQKLLAFLEAQPGGADSRKACDRIETLLSSRSADDFRLVGVDAWSCALASVLNEKGAATQSSWARLLAHTATATSPKPSNAWLKTARGLVDGLGDLEVAATLTVAIGAVGTRSPVPIRVQSEYHPDGVAELDPTLVADRYSDVLRGLLWTTALVRVPDLLQPIGDAADRCFKKVTGHGPRAPKIGNAALWVLSQADSVEATAQLVRLHTRVKHPSTRHQVEKALSVCAERAGLSRQDLEDLAVPRCGLTGIGLLEQRMGDTVAELEFSSCRTTELRFRQVDGKVQKSPPAALKSAFAGELAQLKKAEKELRQLLPAQCDRIERLLSSRRVLPFSEWRKRYLDHPVLGYITRRLIWEFGDDRVPAIPDGEAFVGLGDRRISPRDDDPVALWHPLDSPREVVAAFRERLIATGLTQPFKQAHREIYILTDAERRTGTYSNRFAAHVLKQHQFAALCQARGFRYTLQGNWDSHNTPTLVLPEQGYRVEFWVDPPGDAGDAVIAHSGVYLYVTTDQVRFYREAELEPLPLEQVPPLLFSEVMRDIDLFVSVASLGSDPTWIDGGEERYQTYWHGFAFGDLGERAKSRREVLERLVPRLKIANRCALEDRFLVVRGDLRTYRIHLGSANIQMEPNDQYLCIVPGRGKDSPPGGILLPFEGDSTLSLILSKAFLLAEDKKIKDPTILSQIHRP